MRSRLVPNRALITAATTNAVNGARRPVRIPATNATAALVSGAATVISDAVDSSPGPSSVSIAWCTAKPTAEPTTAARAVMSARFSIVRG